MAGSRWICLGSRKGCAHSVMSEFKRLCNYMASIGGLQRLSNVQIGIWKFSGSADIGVFGAVHFLQIFSKNFE